MKIIQTEELKKRLERQENIILIDVRQPEEHTEFNIGGILLPLGNIVSMHIESIEDHRQDEVVCYCRSGQRSMQACMMLESMGFTNVSNLAGGMMAWRETYGS